MTQYEVSGLAEADIGEVVDVIRRSREELPHERAPTVEEMRVFTVGDSEFRPEGSWIVRAGGSAIAYALVSIEGNRLSAGLDDAYLEFEIVPEERGKGLEKRLIGLACEYIRSRGVGKARTRCVAVEQWRMDALVSDGFAEAYRVFFLVCRGRTQPLEVRMPEGVRLVRRPSKECGDEEITRIVEAFNDTFQDHFSFAPERPERFILFRDACEDPETYSLAMAGDDIVGVCLSSEDRAYNIEKGTKCGWVNILGVRPRYRKMGVGKALLADGMNWVLEQGMDTTYIGVYAMNEKALGLYRSVGFEKDRESLWLERSLK